MDLHKKRKSKTKQNKKKKPTRANRTKLNLVLANNGKLVR